MKIVSVIGSPHGMKGTTGPIVNDVMEVAKDAGARTEIISLADNSVQPCRGCQTCSKTGQCVIDDDFGNIKKALLEADGIILASPNYMHNVSGQMKAFLDRCFGLCHCQMLKGKYGAVVVSSGGPELEMVEKYLMHVLDIFGCWRVGTICAVELQLMDEDERVKIKQEAYNLGDRMVKAISNKEIFPEQEQALQMFFEGMAMVVEMKKEEWPFEYDYWKSRWGM
jgi:multimeric flavodoxin WrbA